MERIPAPLHHYVVGFLENHAGRLSTIHEVARHYESAARVLEVHGDDLALRSLHLEIRVCELLASRDDVTYIGLREDVRGQEIDVIATIAGRTYYFEAKTGELDNEQKRRLTGRARQNGAGLIYVDGLVGGDHDHFSARHLEALIALPAERFLLELEKRAIVKPSQKREVRPLTEPHQSPVTNEFEPIEGTRVRQRPTAKPKNLSILAYQKARAFIKTPELRDNMASVDSWFMHLPSEKIAFIWNKIAEDPTLAEERLHKLNDRERVAWLTARADLLEERLESLFTDEHAESFLSRLAFEISPNPSTSYHATFLTPGSDRPILGNLTFHKPTSQTPRVVNESELQSHGSSAAYFVIDDEKVGLKLILEQRLAKAFADGIHAASTDYIFFTWHTLSRLGISTAKLYEVILASPDKKIMLGDDPIETDIAYDCIAMEHLSKEIYAFSLAELDLAIAQIAEEEIANIESILESYGLSFDNLYSSIAIDRKSGKVKLFDSANLYISDPEKFKHKFLYQRPSAARAYQAPTPIEENELYTIYGGD